MEDFSGKESQELFPAWSVQICDNLDSQLLERIDDFFLRHFPAVFDGNKASVFLRWKIGKDNPFGIGFLTIAKTDSGEVIGVASAARRPLSVQGRIINAVEVGDTFTAPHYRKNGECKSIETINKLENFTIDVSYLNRSIFGRLMYETLARAQMVGIDVAYGTPNELSLRPYVKRFGFQSCNKKELKSIYFLGSDVSRKTTALSVAQQLYAKFVNAVFLRQKGKLIELDGTKWISERERYKRNGKTTSELIIKDSKYYTYRYLQHPVNRYLYFKYVNYESDETYFFVIRLKNDKSIQIVEAPTELKTLRLLEILFQLLEIFKPVSKIVLWRKTNFVENIGLIASGLLIRSNLNFIYKRLDNKHLELKLKSLSLGDSDNG